MTIDDKVRGRVTWETDAALLGDFIIMRSSGMPVYNFCVSVDDAEMRITHVVRAEEHLSNTLRQMLILEALQVKPPVYAHCSLILGADRSKLSKRHGATSVQQFSEQGFVPEAMLNYLANLGWNDGTDQEIYTPQELCNAFDLNRIVKSAAVFDMDKLRWINAQHLRLRSNADLQPMVLRALCSDNNANNNTTGAGADCANAASDSALPSMSVQLLPERYMSSDVNHDAATAAVVQSEQFLEFLRVATVIAQRDMELVTDSNKLVSSCLHYQMDHTLRSDPHVEEVLLSPSLPAVISALVGDYDSGTMPRGAEPDFPVLWKAYLKELGKRLTLKGKGLFHPVRLCLTGRMSGPDVGDQMQLIVYSDDLLLPAVAALPTCMSMQQRIAYLRTFSVTDALSTVKHAQEQKQQQ